MINIIDAITALHPNCSFTLIGDDYSNINWIDIPESPSTIEQVNNKLIELQNAEPIRLLREERNRRLAETDWWAMKEVDGWQMSPQQRVYRKKLRDLPETSPYPMLNENDELTNVDWPEKP